MTRSVKNQEISLHVLEHIINLSNDRRSLWRFSDDQHHTVKQIRSLMFVYIERVYTGTGIGFSGALARSF